MKGSISGAALAVALACASLGAWPQCDGDEQGGFAAYGTIEATEVRVASTIGGTVLEVCCREGAQVKKGQLLVKLDTAELELQLQQAEAQLRAAEARARLTRRATRREDLESAEQALRLAQVQEEAAKRDLARIQQLHTRGAVTPKQLDDAQAGLDMASARADQTQAMLDKVRKGARWEEIQGADALRDQAQAAVALLKQTISHGEIRATLDGRVIYRMVEPGEVARPGVPLLVLADLTHLHADVFVAERQVGAVALGGEVALFADAHGDRRFAARVAHVSDQAEFTPKNVQTEDQRANLVFRVRLEVANPDQALRPGMPARAQFAAETAAAGQGG